MNDYEAIRRLIALYGQLLDSRRFDEWGQLFTHEATFAVWGRVYEGREEIVREIGGMQTREPSKHVVLQPVIDLGPSGHARAWTDLSVFSSTPEGRIEIATIGRYHDILVRDPEDWYFASRVLVMEGEPVPDGALPTPSR